MALRTERSSAGRGGGSFVLLLSCPVCRRVFLLGNPTTIRHSTIRLFCHLFSVEELGPRRAKDMVSCALLKRGAKAHEPVAMQTSQVTGTDRRNSSPSAEPAHALAHANMRI